MSKKTPFQLRSGNTSAFKSLSGSPLKAAPAVAAALPWIVAGARTLGPHIARGAARSWKTIRPWIIPTSKKEVKDYAIGTGLYLGGEALYDAATSKKKTSTTTNKPVETEKTSHMKLPPGTFPTGNLD